MDKRKITQFNGFKCIQLRSLNWSQPKGALKPNYTKNEDVWFVYPKIPYRYGILLKPNGLLVVDVDDPDKIDINLLPDTLTVRTGGGGYHLYYKKREDTKSDFTQDWGELKTTGHVVGVGVMHESGKRYRIVKDLPINDICAADLKPVIKKKKTPKKTRHPTSPGRCDNDSLSAIKSDKYRNDIIEILHDINPRHNRRVWMVGFLHNAIGMSEHEIMDLIDQEENWRDYDRRITQEQISSVINSSRSRRSNKATA